MRNIPGTHLNGVRMSDHRGLKAVFDTGSNTRGPGYWKFNTSLLENQNFIDEMKEYIINTQFTDAENEPHKKWEFLKCKIKTFCIHFSSKQNKSMKTKISSIEKEISEIENLNHVDVNMNRKRHLENELNLLIDNRAKGAQIRSRINWTEKGEKNTSYFLRLESQRQTYNTINAVKCEDNTVVTSNDDIIGAMCDFYKKLYTSSNIDTESIKEYLSNFNPERKLTNEESVSLEALPTVDECRDAIFNMKSNKSPGSDGLPSEYYKVFWNEIGEYLYNSILYSYDQKTLSSSQKMSILTILHKKGDKQCLDNYRPLSLTNTDYKIIAFVFARRLQKIIDRIISYDQSAYIKGRFIGINTRTIVDIFEYWDQNDINGILLFLDFQKAFDSVEWNFMWEALKRFNFGNNFINWIKILYKNPVFRLKNNGWLSKTCNMHRGIRQGCPISAIIFLFVSEILGTQIRNNENIKGFTLDTNNEIEIKVIQHADDCTLPLKNSESMFHALQEINAFTKVSGMKLNMSKTECLLTGALKNNPNILIHGVKVNKTCIKTLGVYIGHDKELCYQNNWIKCISDMEKLFESWKTRNLTLFGKCCVINTLAVSKLIYLASILPFPEQKEIKYMNKLIYTFLWKKKDRIKRATLIGKISEGGIGVIDIESKFKAIKASWVNKLLICKTKLRIFVESLCEKHGVNIEYITQTNETRLCEYIIVKNLPHFYQQIFVFFNESKKYTNIINMSTETFLAQPLWNNRLLMFKGKTLFFKEWIESNLLYVKDVVDSNGLKPIEWFYDNLRYRNNWLCQYKIMKHIFSSFKRNIDFTKSLYFNNSSSLRIQFLGNSYFNNENSTSKFFYQIFLHKKFKKPLHQPFLEKEFGLQRKISWTLIYTQKISNIIDKNVAEFNYKLLHNLLSNRYLASKWNREIDKKCTLCRNDIENNRHLIYECQNVSQIWHIVGIVLRFDVKWKHIIIGFYDEINSKTILLNNIISFIGCRIYKYKMSCRIKGENESCQNMISHVRLSLMNFYKVMLRLNTDFQPMIIKKIYDLL